MSLFRAECVRSRAAISSIVLVALLAGVAPFALDGPWPSSSSRPVVPLSHPTVEARLGQFHPDARSGYRFAAFGDQRASADGEWQRLIQEIAAVDKVDDRLLFMLDTGDDVQDGNYSDQFGVLEGILGGAANLPYLLGVGNHETNDNKPGVARANLARFTSYLDDSLSADRLYYRKDIGPVRFLFLDSNDLVYGDSGTEDPSPAPRRGSRAEAQMAWLVRELGRVDTAMTPTTIVVMHHPIVQSSNRHILQARALWGYSYQGRTLPDLLADGGVDLVLCGHTHTYERFHLTRNDGRQMAVVNLSGRPRASFLWFGAGARRARDIHGREAEWLAGQAFSGLEGWRIVQEEAMFDKKTERDNFAVISVGADGGIVLDMHYLDQHDPMGSRRGPPVRIR
jgi:3',5'-cyclic AMP phosphodiesterase CpdA